MDKIFFGLLIFVPITIIAHFLGAAPLLVFILASLAIIPLARFIGEATEVLSVYTGPAVGGLLNVTFGNATELIIALFALQAGLVEVVKASITGSIIGNLLLVLGLAILVGGSKHKKQTFNKTAVMAGASTLMLAVAALVVPAIFVITAPTVGGFVIEELSIAVAVLMLIMYFAHLWFMLRTHTHLYTEEVGKMESHDVKWSRNKGLLILFGSTAAVAWMSEILVGAIEPIVLQFGWTELFIGVIFVAIIGNAAEHSSAVVMAMKNRMDLALNIAVGSATQIAMFVAPILVLLSLLFVAPMSLVFNSFELVTIILSVMIATLVIQDGESNWLEGLQLLMAYAIIGVAFFLHP